MNVKASGVQLMSVQIRSDKVAPMPNESVMNIIARRKYFNACCTYHVTLSRH